MRITRICASRAARRHCREKHGVEVWEIEEALLGNRDAVRVGDRRYAYDGQTRDGRRLRIIFEVRTHSQEAAAHVVTAIPL